jgi:hypothetical protein
MALNLIDNLSQDIQLLNSSQKYNDKVKSDNNDVKRQGIERTFENMFNKETAKTSGNDEIEINIEVKTDRKDIDQKVENKGDTVSSQEETQYRQKNMDNEKNKTKTENHKPENTVLINLKNIKSGKDIVKDNGRHSEIDVLIAAGNLKHNANIDNHNVKNIKINLNDLDVKTRENIKSVLLDLKKGKLNQAEAGLLIVDALSVLNRKKTGNIDRKNITGISVEKMRTGNEGLHNINPKAIGKNEDVPKESKDNKIKIEDRMSVKNNDEKKIIKKASEKSNTLESAKDVDNKEVKSEIRLDVNELKHLVRNTGEKPADFSKEILDDNREKIFDNIAKNTRITLANNETKFSTMIRPENFGRIDIKFTVKDGKIEGRMILQTQEAADFFKANVEELKAVFSKSNVEMGNIDIALAGQNFNSQSGNRHADHDDGSKTGFIQNVSKVAKTFDDNNVSEYVNGIYDNSMVNIFI